MKLFLIRNLDDKGGVYKRWSDRKGGAYSGGYLTTAPEIVTCPANRYIKLRNFITAVDNNIVRHNEIWGNDPTMIIDRSKLAVIEIDFADIANPSIKFHTLDEALALK